MRDWKSILPHAAAIVRSYATGVTLRQLFYRLVADGTLVNNQPAYKALSSKTAEARRTGRFPQLIDQTRAISRASAWESPHAAMTDLVRQYREDRTQGQEHAIYLGAEKATLLPQLRAWYGDRGLPIVVLRGYASQTYTDDVARDVARDERKGILLYVGDFDPSGEDIERDFDERTASFAEITRLAVRPEHIGQYGLVPVPGKVDPITGLPADSRAAEFMARHGENIQVEVEALDPNDLRALIDAALEPLWDPDAYQAVLDHEEDSKAELEDLAAQIAPE
jgi:hypothetical protein